jgi:hypothetical protein
LGHVIGQDSLSAHLLCTHSYAPRFRSFTVPAIYHESLLATVAAYSSGSRGQRPSVNYCAFVRRDSIGSPRNALQLSLQPPA